MVLMNNRLGFISLITVILPTKFDQINTKYKCDNENAREKVKIYGLAS